ncbi:MAG TPA: hypothetical protein VMW85_02460 [Methanomassiliicoccales archaeon]|nr:hypothetical protein [Methanomassiliicoccales archaeon]
MELSFDEIPEDLWDDWVWLVSPAGLMRAVEEESQPILSSSYQVTSTYTINLPKMVLFDLMWSSRLEVGENGVVDAMDLHRTVDRNPNLILDSLDFLLRNYPLVLRWKLSPEQITDLSPNIWDDISEPPDLLWHVPQELEGMSLDLESLAIDYFNPFIPSLRRLMVHRSVIGVISPLKTLDHVRMAREDPDHVMREGLLTSIEELRSRGLIEVGEGRVRRLTEKGARMIGTEPLSDCLGCRCRVEELLEYELGGEED